MRIEKKYLVDEIGGYLRRSDYIFLADYYGITVSETRELRSRLSEHNAEFHVVKNSLLNFATRDCDYPDLSKWLEGPTALISGGEDASAVAKTLKAFHKESEKVVIKVGLLEHNILSPEEVKSLADLPSRDALKAQLLGLLTTPAQQLLRVLQAVPQGVLNVLDAKSKKE